MKPINIVICMVVILYMITGAQMAYCEKPKYAFGVTGGYLNAENDAKYIYNCESCGNAMGSFNKGTTFTGLTFEYLLDYGIESSIITRLYYNSFSNTYSLSGESFAHLEESPVPSDPPRIVYVETMYDWEVKYSLITFDVLPKVKIPIINLGVFAGISISYLAESRYSESWRIVQPLNVRFNYNYQAELAAKGYVYEDDDRKIRMKEGEIPFKNDIRYGFKAGLQYDFDFWGLQASPFVAIDLPMNDVVNGVNLDCPPLACSTRKDSHWKITYYQAGLDFKYIF